MRRSGGHLRVRDVAAVLAASLVGLIGLVGSAGSASAATAVSGGGSSFAAPQIQQWSADVSHPPADLTVNYAVNSSGAGRDDYAQGYDQYGASDIVYYQNDGSFEQEAETQHPFRYVTVSAGGLAFMYNIVIGGQRWTGLQLTRQEACQIFTGQLTNWDQLASSPGDAILAGVNQSITTVLRSDAAGESYVLSQYCIAVDPSDWSTFVNYVASNIGTETGSGWAGDSDMSVGKPVEFWPPKLEDSQTNVSVTEGGAPEEVNGVVDPNNGGYSIGYVAAVYAQTAGYPIAAVQNSAGQFVQPNATSVQIALSYATPNDLGTFDLDFTGSNPGAYFPSTYSYILAPTTTNSPANAGSDATLGQFLCYAVGQGQTEAARELYAPLSAQVTQLSVAAIQSIPGAPPTASCGTGGPAPVVSTPGVVAPNTGSAANPVAAGGATSGTPSASSAGSKGSVSGTSGSSGSSATTSTTVGGSASTLAGGASSTATTINIDGGSDNSSSGLTSSGAGGESETPTSVELASAPASSETTNSEAYKWIGLGALVCALGGLGVGTAREARK